MSVITKIISIVLKSVADNKISNELAKELVGVSIDEASEAGIKKIKGFIIGEKAKIDNILSRDNMITINIQENHIDYIVAEIKDLFSKIDIKDEVLRQCKYDSTKLKDYFWDEYCVSKSDYIETESDIKKGLYAVSEAILKLVRESEEFEKDFMIQISNSVDDASVVLQTISDYMKENFSKLDNNNQIILNILLMILKQIQKMNMQDNEAKSRSDYDKKFENNKKQDYIKNWNSRLFLHQDNDERPLTLADAFIMPDYKMYTSIKRIGFSSDDTLEQIIEKFIKYDKSSTMLITGVPGIGKSSIVSKIANVYQDNDKVIILRFRDWENEELHNGLIKAICNTLNCKKKDLEDKILIIDGFDELKLLNKRKHLLDLFIDSIKDLEIFKCIFTSRPAYIEPSYFQNVIELQEFDIDKVESFYKEITGKLLKKKKSIESNLKVLGIPVILYMAIMTKVDISENPTKSDLYNRIFGEKGGIFDRFYDGINQYSEGSQIMRSLENIKKYLKFLSKVAFLMFEKDCLILKKGEYIVPELEFEGASVSILEFPIKHLFENTEISIEFIHKSIYEYFVSEYIFSHIYEKVDGNKDDIAGIMGYLFKAGVLSKEILEFLKFKIKENLYDYLDIINASFEIMLKNGLTYYTKKCYRNIFKCEMNVLINMFEIIHLWEDVEIKINLSNTSYFKNNNIRFNMQNIKPLNGNLQRSCLAGANLAKVNFKGMNLKEADLKEANLQGAILVRANLQGANLMKTDLTDADLRGADLTGADLRRAKLVNATLDMSYLQDVDLCGADLTGIKLSEVDLSSTYLREANLSAADLRNAYLAGLDLTGTFLRKANLRKANLIEVNLSNANMQEVNLQEAALREAYLRRTNLMGADLTGADLTGSFLKGAYLKNANLSRIDLHNVDLTGVDLYGIIFDESQIDYLEKKYYVQDVKIQFYGTKKVVSYEEYQNKRK